MRTLYLCLSLFCALFFLSFASCERSSSQQANNEPAPANEMETGSWDPQQDSSFLLDAFRWGSMLNAYNELAAQKAPTPAVRSFAERSAAWHQKVNKEIQQLTAQKELRLTSEAGEELQKKLDELKSLPADEFEQAYLQTLSNIQNRMLNRCQEAAGEASDKALRDWAASTVPYLEAHAQTVTELTEIIKN